MNLKEKLLETFGMNGIIIMNKAKARLAEKPGGFHPFEKKEYRRGCRYIGNEWEDYIERKRRGRIIGNKGVSKGTKLILEQLKNNAR